MLAYKWLRASANRQKNYDSGGIYKWQEENIAVGTAFADLMFGLAGLSVVNGGIPKGNGAADNADFVEAEIGARGRVGNTIAANVDLPIGDKIAGFTKHGVSQVLGRDGGRGVSSSAITDAVTKPKEVVTQTGKYGTTYKYIGESAVVVLNESRHVITAYATNNLGLRGSGN